MSLEQINKYIILRKSGLNTSRIATEIGVSTTTVSRYDRFIGIHGEHILRELPNLVLDRPLSNIDYASMVEWAYENDWSCDATAFLFMVSRKKLSGFYKTRMEQGQPLLGAEPMSPPSWASLTGAFSIKNLPVDVPTCSDLEEYKKAVIPDTASYPGIVSSCSYEDVHEEQPKPIERKIGRAKKDVKISRPAKIMRSKAHMTQKKQERALAALNDNHLDEGYVPPKADDAVASIVKPSPLEKGIEAIEAQDEIESPKRGRPHKINHNSPGFDELPAEVQNKHLKKALLEIEAENAALKKSIASLNI